MLVLQQSLILIAHCSIRFTKIIQNSKKCKGTDVFVSNEGPGNDDELMMTDIH